MVMSTDAKVICLIISFDELPYHRRTFAGFKLFTLLGMFARILRWFCPDVYLLVCGYVSTIK